MGGRCSKNSNARSSQKYSNPYANRNVENQYDLQSNRTETRKLSVAPQVPQKMDKTQAKEEVLLAPEGSSSLVEDYASSEDEFYDGIPRFRRSSSQKSRSRRAKVSEVSSLLGRAGSAGLERAVEVLDSLGSTMSSLNPSSGFASGVTAKNNELSILSFEVANTIVKGSNIMQSLSRRSTRILKEVVLLSVGVQQLVSTDMDELLKIVAADKREELRIFAGEIVRFGNRCKDPQWHNLDRFFEKHGRERTPQKQLQDEAELMMQQLMVLVQHTAELYQEMHRLDRYEQEYQQKRLEQRISNSNQRGNSLTVLAAEIKTQRKLVRSLKKKSLWYRSLEEVMEKLVDIVLFLNREISNNFGNKDDDATEEKSLSKPQRLGPSGLALHYANIILLIDSIVARANSIPRIARDTLYQSLPPNIKSSLRSKLHSFHVKEELSTTEIKAEMEKTLQWLVPIATNTAKAHHGFGWVGEWANPGSESNRQSPIDVMQIETLHHADRQKTEAYIHELLLWLNYFVSRSQVGVKGGNAKPSITSAHCSPLKITDQQSVQKVANCPSPTLANKDQKMQQEVSDKTLIQGMSTSQDFDKEEGSKKLDNLSKSNISSASSECTEQIIPSEKLQSSLPTTDFALSNEKKLDMIDRVEINR